MKQFSIYNYENLPESFKEAFNKSLAKGLSSLLNDLKSDDVLGKYVFEEFISIQGGAHASSLVTDVFSDISGGIQSGSGNQNLFQSVLNCYTDSWREINKLS